ncbi:hypothetical protein XELAEV_18008876mg [Xenopus laevis]|uniref:Uncharacterized protein n=1 Tax=Xenopus laevis TaxID=8355 RepID=A0A974I0B1_XENLA|nr:hypothetical protein XELAEV_18008876mg [Xenopus laevis]
MRTICIGIPLQDYGKGLPVVEGFLITVIFPEQIMVIKTPCMPSKEVYSTVYKHYSTGHSIPSPVYHNAAFR